MTEENLTFGCELEWSDIDRRIDIPSYLGSWEGPKIAGYWLGSELDIVNTKDIWRGVAVDPLCVECPVGGEIHTVPSETIDTQMYRIMRIMDLFPTVGVSCVNHGHIHVGIPNLRKDPQILKNIMAYLDSNYNELHILEACCGYDNREHDRIKASEKLQSWVKDYLLIGDAKSINPELYIAVRDANSVQEILHLLESIKADDLDWVTGARIPTENSHRTTVNVFNATKGSTIEFRVFRASTNPVEIYSCLKFAEVVTKEMLKGVEGIPVLNLLRMYNFHFPKLNFDEELAYGWQQTRQTKGRCGCLKKWTGYQVPSEDSILSENGPTLSDVDNGYVGLLNLCIADVEQKDVVRAWQ